MSNIYGLSELALFVYILLTVVSILGWINIIYKTGNNGCIGFLITLIPIVNFIYFAYIAFSKWPVEIENEKLRARLEQAEKLFEKGKDHK